MARRRSNKSKGKGTSIPLLVGLGVGLVVAVILLSGVFKQDNGFAGKKVNQNFSIANYRSDGSRFASSGNRYILEGRVESIESHGNDRVVFISIRGNKDERLPLLMTAENRGNVNITRGDTFAFETECRTGLLEDGSHVKGILLIKNVETR